MTKFFRPLLAIYLLFSPLGYLYSAMTGVEPEKGGPVKPGDAYNSPMPLDSSRFYGEFMYTMFVLGCVIAAMLLASWFIRRMMQTKVHQLNQTSDIKIKETRLLGHKSLLHLIEVKGMTILISETPAGVTSLLKYQSDEKSES